MFESVLVANRGEIAARIITACQELGIRASAVYSDVDRDALHVRVADAAFPIGPAPARASYLNVAAILAAARASGAEAIHPGYGFLSENADFAEACAAAGIVFIGPPADVIRLMGSKIAAKLTAEAAGVPTVPGYSGEKRDARTLEREAERVGYPVMLKAAAGGGGKGMRVVEEPQGFREALAAAQREALAAFGDDAVFIEKLIVAPRHIEFQILADQHGNVVHLGERECSIQRRHQKIIEESPSVALSPAQRAEMGAAAVRAARQAGYVNAGTCEFLLDADGRYYFLEMNTRLQVEHPVTELVTGRDLVHLQLAVAAGEPLPFAQDAISPRGHAIEARLYAEDPAHDFLPSTGTVLAFAVPPAPGVRVDAGIATGDAVTMHYDPMLAKLIVFAPDRQQAVQRLSWALDHTAVLGVATNLPLLRAIAAEPDFRAGRTSTAYLEAHDLAAGSIEQATPQAALVLAACWETLAGGQALSTPAATGAPYNPWTSQRSELQSGERRLRYSAEDGHHTVVLTSAPGADGYAVTVDGAPFCEGADAPVTAVLHADGAVALGIGARRVLGWAARRGHEVLVSLGGNTYVLGKPRPLDVDATAHARQAVAGRSELVAPMAGTLIKVNVAEGERVEAHQTLVVLGAMKMEHTISAPHDARVVSVPHAAGDVVPGGELLVELAADDETV